MKIWFKMQIFRQFMEEASKIEALRAAQAWTLASLGFPPSEPRVLYMILQNRVRDQPVVFAFIV